MNDQDILANVNRQLQNADAELNAAMEAKDDTRVAAAREYYDHLAEDQRKAYANAKRSGMVDQKQGS